VVDRAERSRVVGGSCGVCGGRGLQVDRVLVADCRWSRVAVVACCNGRVLRWSRVVGGHGLQWSRIAG